MKNLSLLQIALLVLYFTFNYNALSQSWEIKAPIGTYSVPSNYINTSLPNDPVYIFCSCDSTDIPSPAKLWVVGPNPNCDYEWQIFDTVSTSSTFKSFIPFTASTIQNSDSSIIDSLSSGFYKAIVTSFPGQTNQSIDEYFAHVFINHTTLYFDSITEICEDFYLSGGVASNESAFTIYDPVGNGQQTLSASINAYWSCDTMQWDTTHWGTQDFLLNPVPFISPFPYIPTDFYLSSSSQIIHSNGTTLAVPPCSYSFSRFCINLMTDATVFAPDTICSGDLSPFPAIPLSYGGMFDGINTPLSISSGGYIFPGMMIFGTNYYTYSFPASICYDIDTFSITLIEAPEIMWITDTIVNQNNEYQVRFGYAGNKDLFIISDSATGQAINGSFSSDTWSSPWYPFGDSYSIFITDSNNCNHEYISGNPFLDNSSFEVFLKKSYLSITPNPFQSDAEIEFYLFMDSEIELSILDLNGSIIQILDYSFRKKGRNNIVFQNGILNPGIYICRLKTNKLCISKKVVISSD